MKRKLLMIITLMFAMIGTLGLAAACGGGQEEEPPVAGEEVGEYYCDVNGKEYSLTLTDECQYTLVMGGDPISGSYTPDGENLMFKEGDDAFLGSYYKDVITLSYHSTSFTFLRKTEYTITFETNGGSKIDPVTVYNGRTVAQPTPPQRGSDVFVGWYTDGGFKSEYSFSEAVKSSFTLYARFVTPIKPEYTVTFDLNGAEGTAPTPVPTVGHQAFGLPTPVWTGHTFIGWWVSHDNDAAKLTYQYEEQLLGGDTTFFAVWAGEAPAVSVGEKEISWTVEGSASSFTLVIKNLTADKEVERRPVDGKTYAFDFAEQDAGEYLIEVTANGHTGRAYYKNKALDKVTVFNVVNNTLLFNPVANATSYLLEIECGAPELHPQPIPIDAESRAYDFSKCTAKNGKIVFTVTALAEGYLSSVSEPFEVSRTLSAASNIDVEPNTELLRWAAVSNATSYDVVIEQGTDEVYSGNVSDGTTLSLKFLNKGTYTVSITPKARGWESPAAATYTYDKATLAAPSNIRADVQNSKIVWDKVTGATQYEVMIGGRSVATVTSNEIEFDDSYRVSGVTDYPVSVRALTGTGTGNSLWSDAYNVRYGKLGGSLRYSNGVLSWDPVFGVSTYYLSINGGEGTEYTNVTSITLGRFNAAGRYSYSLRAVYTGGGSDTIGVTVNVWEISFSAADSGEVGSLFVATGDTLTLPDAEQVTRYGYTLEGWYTEEGGGVLYNDSTYVEDRSRTLYAHWSPLPYHVSLKVGAYGQQTQEIRDGVTAYFDQKVELPIPESTDPAFAFAGWYDSAVGGTAYTTYDGVIARYKQGIDITLYAQWMNVLAFTPVYRNGAIAEYSVSKSPDIIPSAVTTITIPQYYKGVPVTTISDFTDLSQLEVIHIPDSVRDILVADQETAFTGCSKLSTIDIYETDYNGDKYYFSKDGVLFYNNPYTQLCELKLYPAAREGDVYDVPDGVQSIPSGALFGLSKLHSISFPSSLTFIEQKAVGASSYSYIETISFREPADGTVGDPLVIQPQAFYEVTNIKHITLPARMENFDFWNMFYASYSSFSYLETIEVVGTGKYRSQDNMILKDEGTDVELVLYPRTKETFELPAGVTKIGDRAVQKNTNITSITIPGSISRIGESAFYGTTYVKSLTFEGKDGDLPLRIEASAFYQVGNYAYSLTELTLPQNCVYVGRFAFGNTQISTVHIDLGPTMTQDLKIEDSAFSMNATDESSYNSSVTDLYIGPGIKNVNFMSAFGSRLQNIHLDDGNPYYAMNEEETALFTAAMTEIVWIKDIEGPFTIPSTVTRIGADNFKYRSHITEITIPASVTEIGSGAFLGCSGLEKVEFLAPEGGGKRAPLKIGSKAFYGCSGLTEITFPDGTTELGTSVLGGCSKLKTVNLPNTIEKIDDYVSGSSSSSSTTYFGLFENDEVVSTITMPEGGEHYSVIDNTVYLLAKDEKTGKYYESELIYFAIFSETTEITIPDTVERIRSYAFNFDHYELDEPALTTVKFKSEELAQKYDAEKDQMVARELVIETKAFYDAGNITEIVVPRGTVSIDSQAFYMAGITAFTVPNTVRNLGVAAFYYCESLSELTFEKGNEETPLRLEDGSYDTTTYGLIYQTQVASIELPERTTYIGNYAFAHCPLAEIKIPASVTAIGENAFYSYSSYSSKLEKVTFAPNSKLQSIGAYAFGSSKITEITIPASVTTIGNSAFYGCAELTSVTFEDNSLLEELGSRGSTYYGVFGSCTSLASVNFGANSRLRYIGPSVFSGCTALTEMEFPLSLEEIGNSAFSGSGIQTVTFEQKEGEKSKLHVLGSAFSYTGIREFTFPETEQEIILPDSLFSGCSELASVHLSSTVYNVKNAFFEGCTALESITVAAENPIYFTEDQFLLYKDTYDIVYVFGTLTGHIAIHEDAKQILPHALANTEIESVFIPYTVVHIGEAAFEDCKKLTKVEFETGSALLTLGADAFSGCSLLKDINFTATTRLETLEKDYSYSDTFMNCASLETLDFSKTLITEFPGGTFTGCSNLHTILSPRTLTAFNATLSTTEVATLDLSNTQLVSIGNSVFSNSATFESISVPTTLTTIGSDAFMNCKNLTEFDFSRLTSIGSGAFYNTGLTKVTLYGSVTNWGYTYSETSGVFGGCQDLEEVVFAANLPYDPDFSNYMFTNCPKLSKLTFESGTQIGAFADYMFQGCTALTSVTLPASCTVFDYDTAYYTFYKCTGLRTVDLSACPATSLYSYMFSGCTGIEEFSLPSGLTEIPRSLFSGFGAISHVTIPSSVTSIGAYAFENCTSLTSVDIHTSVTSIGSSAFSGCTGLQSITIPSGVTEIASDTFRGCTSLTTVDLQNVTSIGYYAFAGCSRLVSIEFPKSLNTIGSSAFSGSSLTSVDFSGTGVEELSGYLFEDCTTLTNIILPVGLTYIGSGCFKNTGLLTFTVPASVTVIGDGAFEGCEQLLTVDFECGDFVAYSNGSYLPSELFLNCTALQKVTFKEDGLTAIGKGWFSGCTALSQIQLSDTITALNDSAFLNCAKLKDINVDNITVIGDDVFTGCKLLLEDQENWHDGVFYLKNITISFDDAKIKELGGKVEIREGTTSIGAHIFKGSQELKEVTLPQTLVSLGANVFENCPALTKADLSKANALTIIPDDAFLNCENLSEVLLPQYVVTIGESAFEGTAITAITLPDAVVSIDNYVFRNCVSLGEIKLPANVKNYSYSSGTDFGYGVFEGCVKLTKADLSATGLTEIPQDTFKGCILLTDIQLPTQLTELGESCFEGTGITRILLPDTVVAIDNYAFKDCASLEEIKLPAGVENSSYYSSGNFGKGVFEGCVKLTKADLSETGITKLPNDTFKGCTLLTSLDFMPKGLTVIGANCFEGTGLSGAITIPDAVTGIGTGAFKDCAKITSIALPAALQNYYESYYDETWESGFGKNVFEGCTLLTTLDFSKCTVLTRLPAEAFAHMTNLTDITLPDTMTEIGAEAFLGCVNLKQIKFPAGLAEIGNSAFEGCVLLSELAFPAGLTTIGVNAFKGCTGLQSVTLPAAIKDFDGYIGSSGPDGFSMGAFEDCTGLLSADFSVCTGLTLIPKDAFKGCTQLKDVSFPAGLLTIGDGAFENCTALVFDSIPDTVEDIGLGAFRNCTALTKLVMPAALKDYAPQNYTSTNYVYPSDGFAPNAFEGCTGLASVDFTACTDLTAIPDNAFVGCTDLADVKLCATLLSIGNEAFKGCGKLEALDLKSVTALGADAFTGTKLLDTQSNWENGIYYMNKIAVLCDNEKIEKGTVTLRPDTVGVAGNLFKDCTNLTSIDLSALQITELPVGLFRGCTNLTSVTLPATVTAFGAYCFAGCTSLSEIPVPAALTALGEGAFMNTAITEIDLSLAQITAIGPNTFNGCKELVTVTLHANLATIGDNAFKGCTALSNFTWPAYLTAVGNSAFEGCTSLTSADFGYYNFATLGESAFKGCTNLSSVTFGADYDYYNFVLIGASAFEGCTNLTAIDLSNCSYLTTIGEKAFYGCSRLASVKIPGTIRNFGAHCFANTAMESFRVPSLSYATIVFGEGVFDGLTDFTLQFFDRESWLRDHVQDFEGFLNSLPEGTKVEYGVSDY